MAVSCTSLPPSHKLLRWSLLSDLHVGVDAQQDDAVEENGIMFAKVEERIGAVPSGSTTDAELVERFLSSLITL